MNDQGAELWVIGIKLAGVGLLIFLNGFFVAAEFALVKIRDSQLQPFISRGSRRARTARVVLGNLDKSLSACQLGITLASLALGWIGEPVFEALLTPLLDLVGITVENLGSKAEVIRHWISVAAGFSALTFLHIVVGEQAPKWLAIQRPLPTTLWIAQPLQIFNILAYPLIWGLNHASLWFLKQLGLQSGSESEAHHSEDELRLLFAEAQNQNGTTALGRAIVMNALDLKHRIARDVMRPRAEMVFLSNEQTVQECIEIADKTRFSRFPLTEGGHPDRTLGVVHVKDLHANRSVSGSAALLQRSARRLIYIPETARLETVLQTFLDRKLHMAIVVDEYGGTLGMLTLENILEELVGQIQDEFDAEKPMVVQVAADHWELQGSLPLHDLENLTGKKLPSDEVATASGWVTERLEGFPKPGDVLRVGDYDLVVEECNGRMVERLTLRKSQAHGSPSVT